MSEIMNQLEKTKVERFPDLNAGTVRSQEKGPDLGDEKEREGRDEEEEGNG